MASNDLFYGPDAYMFDPLTSNTTPTTSHSSTPTAPALPVLHHSASAPALTTLSDSRPPSSQDDDALGAVYGYELSSGGILLAPGEAQVDDDTLAMPLHLEGLDEGVDMSGIPDPFVDSHLEVIDAEAVQPFTYQVPVLPNPPSFAAMLSSMYEDPDVTYEGTMYTVEDKMKFADITKYYDYCLGRWKTGAGPTLESMKQPEVVTKQDVRDGICDMQGIDWKALDTTRGYVRKERWRYEYDRAMSLEKGARKALQPSRRELPNCETFFTFYKTTTTPQFHIPHYQLRNLLTCTSRHDIFYATADNKVMRADTHGSEPDCIMSPPRRSVDKDPFITTLCASDEVLLAGRFSGQYALSSLYSAYGTPPTQGQVTHAQNGITNHAHIFSSRTSYTPQVAFCSNDSKLRLLDCATNSFTHEFAFQDPVNCSVTSPDGRLRVVVGDFRDAFLTNSETGEVLQRLKAHQDDIFACAWADDGIHVATAAQDYRIAIWDARYWDRPLATEKTLSIPRSLRFSPIGGGPRVLVSAEADDYISIIDAVSFQSSQVIDFFGKVAGTCFTPDGSSLFVANADKQFGGLMEFERAGVGARYRRTGWDSDEEMDWASDQEFNSNSRDLWERYETDRRGLSLSHLTV